MRARKIKKIILLLIPIYSLMFFNPVFASNGEMSQIDGFIKNIISAISGLAGLIATGFFVIGGLGYITSSGNPHKLEQAKRTLLYSGIGLSIVIGAFVLSNVVTSVATNAFGN